MEAPSSGRCRMPRHVQVLLENRALLEEHLVFDERIYSKLAQMRVIPDTMLRDVRDAQREEKVSVLISHVGKMGPRSVRRLCDMLHATGYSMVAEHLRYNTATEQADKAWFLETQEKFPMLRQTLSQVEMTAFYSFLQDKITEQVAKRMWQIQSRDRAVLLGERTRITANEIHQENIIRKKQEQIHSLKDQLGKKETEIKEVENRLNEVQHEHDKTQSSHVEQRNVLIQSHEASERANRMTHDRLNIFNTQIKRMNVRIRKLFGESSEHVENDINNIKVSRLEDNLERLLTHIGRLERETKRLMQRQKSERKRMLRTLSVEDNRQDLCTAYQQSTGGVLEALRSVQATLTRMLADLYSQHSVAQMVYRRLGERAEEQDGAIISQSEKLSRLAQSCKDKVTLLENHLPKPATTYQLADVVVN